MKLIFKWNLQKETYNKKAHSNIDFKEASTVFLYDGNLFTIYDEKHSTEIEDRWITIGLGKNGRLLVVVHTHEQIDEINTEIRIISARKALKNEIKQYRGEK